jgi:hypothetical protein
MRTIYGTLIVSALIVTGPGVAAARTPSDAPSRARITVRVYDAAGTPYTGRPRAIAVANGILKAAGLDVFWLACKVAVETPDLDPCAPPPRPDELVVHFDDVRNDLDNSRALQLGYSVVDTTVGAGTLATIYLVRAQVFAEQSGSPLDTVLGRAIAHEIGHLLLGTNDHAAVGVMRATWSSRSESGLARDWLFTRADAVAMRDAVRWRADRLRVLPVPGD